ncbi:MAG: HisS family protein, partial [Methylovirgula sp.]
VGTKSVAADAELCMMAADTLERLGIKRGDYVIKVSSRKVLDGVLEAIELGGIDNAERRLAVLRAVDKRDRLREEGVRLLLGPGRKDESGDFTKGVGLGSDQIKVVIEFVRAQRSLPLEDVTAAIGNQRETHGRPLEFQSLDGAPGGTFRINNNVTIEHLRTQFGSNPIARAGIDELQFISNLTSAAGYTEDQIRIDPSVVRGLEYYTGPVFEAELTFETKGEDGKPIRFGSIGGGGRYDGLVGRFRGEDVPATGFSIGVSRLHAALKAINSPIVGASAAHGPVVVLVLDQTELARYQGFVTQLRNENIAAELYLGSSGMNAQLKYADKRGAICAVIQGSDERGKGEIAIRDLVLGAELAASTKDRADYLDLRTRAQFIVPESNLVSAVREVLARHK